MRNIVLAATSNYEASIMLFLIVIPVDILVSQRKLLSLSKVNKTIWRKTNKIWRETA